MTPAEWNACSDAQLMLDFLRDIGKLTDRKARLFSAEVCRRMCLPLDAGTPGAVEMAERYADGLIGDEEWAAFSRASWEESQRFIAAGQYPFPPPPVAPPDFTVRPGSGAKEAYESLDAVTQYLAAVPGPAATHERVWVAPASLLRDLFAPFRTAALNAAWRTPAVMELAQRAYENRSFSRLPDLADALAEASCTDAPLLEHLRGPGPHTRGCFALDCVLGKS